MEDSVQEEETICTWAQSYQKVLHLEQSAQDLQTLAPSKIPRDEAEDNANNLSSYAGVWGYGVYSE